MLCKWCEYKQVCHQWSPLYKNRQIAEKKQHETRERNLVDRYIALKQRTRQQRLDLYAELEELEIEMIAYAKKKNTTALTGSNHTAKITTHTHYIMPEKGSDERTLLLEKLKNITKKENITNIDTPQLNKMIIEGILRKKDIDQIVPMLKTEKRKRISL